jgi:stearoyl-CoA 9-desaturase NADPH oxidoreductase
LYINVYNRFRAFKLSNKQSKILNRIAKKIVDTIALPQAIDFWMKQFNINYSPSTPTARVVQKQIIGDAVKVILKPSKSFGEFVAGQHIRLKIPVDFINVERCYSIANLPNPQNLLELYVKVQGQVSEAIKTSINVGEIIEISKPFGDNAKKEFNAFIAGGIGITTIWPLFKAQMAKLSDNASDKLTLLYLTRLNDDKVDLQAENQVLMKEIQNSRWFKRGQIQILDGRKSLSSPELIRQKLQGIQRAISCGSEGFNNTLEQRVVDNNLNVDFTFEHYADSSSAVPVIVTNDPQEIKVTLLKSQKTLTVTNQNSLLDSLLDAGLKVRHGCKQGICQECVCTVSNASLDNGAPSQVQLCKTFPNNDVELEL